MSFTPEVEAAVEELRDSYPNSTVDTVPDGQGGAFVTVDPVDIGEQYVPCRTWIKFQVTFQYPVSDVYPHFISPDVRRVQGEVPANQPLGEATSLGSFTVHGVAQQAIQISRRSQRLNPATDTAALKLEKVLDWLRSR